MFGVLNSLIRGRLIDVTASLRIENGVVLESSFKLFILGRPSIPLGMDETSGLVGKATEYMKGFDPYDFREQRLLHPEYWIGKPGGCEGCIKLYTGFTPLAGRQKMMELTDFNFSCITRWSDCSEETEILPAAGKQFEQESSGRDARNEAFEQCKVPLEFWGREYSEFALLRINRVTRLYGDVGHAIGKEIFADVEIKKTLKGDFKWREHFPILVDVFDRGEGIKGWSALDMQADRDYIVAGVYSPYGADHRFLAMDDCGLIPFNTENLAAIQRGIDESAARQVLLQKTK